MADIVVTLPLSFGLRAWLDEGDGAGEEWTGRYYDYSVATRPEIEIGERVYVVYNKRLIGYAPLALLSRDPTSKKWLLTRAGGAVACTVDREIPGFRGWRYRFWRYEEEIPFHDWKEVLL